MVDIIGDKQPFEDIFRGDENLEIKGDKEKISKEEKFDYIWKKRSMDESIEAVMEMRNQDLILMKNEGILSQKGNQMSLISATNEYQVQENVNEDDGTRITLGEELQRESKEKCTEEEETMLAENIVKDHQFTMIIGTVEIAMKVVETVSEEEEHPLKDVKEEEVYGKALAKGERTLTEECFAEDEKSL